MCADGFTSAWILSKIFKKDADYRAVDYDQELDIKGLQDHEVYILDFSFPRATIIELSKVVSKLVILDHHKSSAEILKELPEYQASDDIISYLCQSKLVSYVEDRDLWRWTLPRSREFSAWLRSRTQTFEQWDMIVDKISSTYGFDKVCDMGFGILEHIDLHVGILCKNPRIGKLNGHKVLAVNSPLYISEIGEKLVDQTDIVLIWYQDGAIIKADLRSKNIDVSKVAAFWGGGGHKNAAGFRQDSWHPRVWELG